MALEGACRKRHVEMQTVRKGEVFSWPTWNADQVLEEHHRKTSEEKLRRWREEGLQGPCPSPPEVEPAPSVPLIDPYAPSTAYPEAPPEAPPPVASPSPPPAPAPVPVPKPHQEARQVRQVPQTPVAPKAAPKQAPQVPKVAPETESWSSKQQRLKKEQREARLAENLRRFCSSCCLRRAARGGQEPEETRQERPGYLTQCGYRRLLAFLYKPLKGPSEDAKMHSAENLQDPQSYGGSLGSKEPATKASGSSHSKPRGALDEPEIGEDEIDLQGVPLRVLRSKRPVSGSELRKLRIMAHEEVLARQRTQEELLGLCHDMGERLRLDVDKELTARSEAE
eukprot:symbB.v1.2.027639.t2/scaffold2850.1/size68925/1